VQSPICAALLRALKPLFWTGLQTLNAFNRTWQTSARHGGFHQYLQNVYTQVNRQLKDGDFLSLCLTAAHYRLRTEKSRCGRLRRQLSKAFSSRVTSKSTGYTVREVRVTVARALILGALLQGARYEHLQSARGGAPCRVSSCAWTAWLRR
jgi:hypothetical protein